MEEGPEPHEFIEKTVEHHHEQEHKHAVDPGHRLPAVTAAMLAVLAALGSLLSGHAANQAILKQSKATDQWAYFQSKSTKGHLYDVSRQIVAALSANHSQSKASQEVLDGFDKQVQKYDKEKAELEEKAKELEDESAYEFRQHHHYALGIACFQVGIVLSSVSILVRYRLLFWLSLVAGLAGLVFLAFGVCA
jgi:hypothetical protein